MGKKRLVFKVLHEPTGAQAKSNTPAVDVVLVHGLDGDPIKTWTEPDSGVLWPKTLLPEKFPGARVMSFGYNADMYLNRSKAGIRANAEALLASLNGRRRGDPNRPIVFVAHCLGGLIVKQLLSFANHDPERHGVIGTSTRGILFLGTPNNAVDKEQWETLAKAYAPFEREGQLSGLVVALTRDARDLAEVNEDFVHIADRYPIFSFYETQEWEDTGACILSEQAARMFVDSEKGIPVGADHVEMCQIADPEDLTFVNICQCIEDALAPVSAPGGGSVSGEDSVAEETLDSEAREAPTDESSVGGQGAVQEEHDPWIEELILAGKRSQTIPLDKDSHVIQRFEHLFIHDTESRAKENTKVKVEVKALAQDNRTQSWITTSTRGVEYEDSEDVNYQFWELSRDVGKREQWAPMPVRVEHIDSGTRTSTGWQRVPAGVNGNQDVFESFYSDSVGKRKTGRGWRRFVGR